MNLGCQISEKTGNNCRLLCVSFAERATFRHYLQTNNHGLKSRICEQIEAFLL